MLIAAHRLIGSRPLDVIEETPREQPRPGLARVLALGAKDSRSPGVQVPFPCIVSSSAPAADL